MHFRAYSDLYYIENWSFRLDLYIIWKTFTQVFRAQNCLLGGKFSLSDREKVLSEYLTKITRIHRRIF